MAPPGQLVRRVRRVRLVAGAGVLLEVATFGFGGDGQTRLERLGNPKRGGASSMHSTPHRRAVGRGHRSGGRTVGSVRGRLAAQGRLRETQRRKVAFVLLFGSTNRFHRLHGRLGRYLKCAVGFTRLWVGGMGYSVVRIRYRASNNIFGFTKRNIFLFQNQYFNIFRKRYNWICSNNHIIYY